MKLESNIKNKPDMLSINFREDWTFIRIGITTHNILDGRNNKSIFKK